MRRWARDDAVKDPLANPTPLVERVYAYAAYRLGDGPDADDVTSSTFERALRYRTSYDPDRGTPAAWLLGIARRVTDDYLRRNGIEIPSDDSFLLDSEPVPTAYADRATRLDLRAAVATLDTRDRELIALRYGADLKAREIAVVLGQRTNAVEVALHRALERLRAVLDPDTAQPPASTRAADRPTADRHR